MNNALSRRELVGGAAAALLVARAHPAAAAPSSPVALARCDSYALDGVLGSLRTLLDQTGGLRRLVSGKTVAVKVNLVNTPSQQAAGLPASRTYHVHPNVARALAMLLDEAGARRIRFLESTFSRQPIEEFFTSGGWNLRDFQSLRAAVDFEDTRNLGRGKKYHRVRVPWGGSLYPAYDLNHSYVDCDVYVSLAKLKNHSAAGVTLAMKNNFGITPTALYGGPRASEENTSNRANFHSGMVPLPVGLPAEVDPASPRRQTYRVPRHTVDAVGIRPIHLAIIDGIETVSGGEGPWVQQLVRQTPRLLIAGRNPVCTDAIATACMGYDPMAGPATGPFPGDNHLALAAALGLGTNDPRRIEVVGLPLDRAIHPYRYEPRMRNG